MTVGGWFLFGFYSLLIMGVACLIAYVLFEYDHDVAAVFLIVGGAMLVAALGFGMNWRFTNTAAGQRSLKTEKVNFDKGIERTVCVYDVEGELIKQYEGKFDVVYADNRIMFDDENGKRHIVYYPTGTVLVDEK